MVGNGFFYVKPCQLLAGTGIMSWNGDFVPLLWNVLTLRDEQNLSAYSNSYCSVFNLC
jgi:hypothetical protein